MVFQVRLVLTIGAVADEETFKGYLRSYDVHKESINVLEKYLTG